MSHIWFFILTAKKSLILQHIAVSVYDFGCPIAAGYIALDQKLGFIESFYVRFFVVFFSKFVFCHVSVVPVSRQ
jgi:hypothetical protein